MKQKTKQKGFTTIELLVVIAIIGLLASVILLALSSTRGKSRDARRVADMRQLAAALELYFTSNSTYPQQATAATTIPGLSPTFISVIPTAPAPSDGSCTSAQNTYNYTSTTATTFTITFCLGAATGSITSGTHTMTAGGIQ